MAGKSKTAPKRRGVDWDAVERDYRAGVLSLAEIGNRHGVTKGRISQVAKAKAWERDLSKKIQAKAEAKLNAAAVNGALNAESNRIAEAQVVEANAHAIASVRLAHREDIRRGRSLVLKLLGEVEAQTQAAADFETLSDLLRNPDEKGKDALNEIYRKVTSLGGRVANVKALSDALKNLVTLEREAWGLDAKEPSKDGEPTNLSDAELELAIASINERLTSHQS